MRHNWCIEEGYFVYGTVDDLPLTFLIDTGSNVSILNRSIFDRLSPEVRQTVQPTNKKLLTVTGEVTPFLGRAVLNIEIGSQSLQMNVLFADIEKKGIIGLDFLKEHNCDLMLTQSCLKISNEKIRCFANSRDAQPTCCRIIVTKHCTIPPETEMLIEGHPAGVIDKNSTGLVEVDTGFLHKKELLVAKALGCTSNGTVPICIANPYNESISLNKDTVVATYKSLKPEELVSVNATQSNAMPSNTTQSNATQSNAMPSNTMQSNATQSNVTQSSSRTPNSCTTNDVPDHIKDMYAESAQNLNSDFKQLLIDFQDTFSRSSHDLGRTHLVEYEINLQPGTKPIKQAPYRLPLAKRQEVENEIKLMAEKDLIEESFSPWSSPVIIVPKKSGGIRFCIDYRNLNKVTIQDSQALQRIDDSLDALGGAKWFSKLDLRGGFHQIGVKRQDRPKTAFCIPGGGLWQFKVMPQGSTNSPAVFERLMEQVFHNLNYKTLLIYLDDIIVYGKTFEVHLHNLREALQRLSDSQLKLSPEKCSFFTNRTTFLGHLITENGLSVDPEKVKTVQEWQTPTNVTEVRSFVGLCSYLRKFFSWIQYHLQTIAQTYRKGA